MSVSNGDLAAKIEDLSSLVLNRLCVADSCRERRTKRDDYLPWQDYFMSSAYLAAMRSKDPNTQDLGFLREDLGITSGFFGRTSEGPRVPSGGPLKDLGFLRKDLGRTSGSFGRTSGGPRVPSGGPRGGSRDDDVISDVTDDVISHDDDGDADANDVIGIRIVIVIITDDVIVT
ncbi:deoxycytidylate deaminase [Ixodes scapularis]